MKVELTATEIFFYGSVLSLVSGSVGWFIQRRFSKSDLREKERDDRQRMFRAFLQQWPTEVARTPEHNIDKLWADYSAKSIVFSAEASKVYGDILPLDEFRSSCDRLSGLRRKRETLSRMRYETLFDSRTPPPNNALT
jgi:hypothetical protein